MNTFMTWWALLVLTLVPAGAVAVVILVVHAIARCH